MIDDRSPQAAMAAAAAKLAGKYRERKIEALRSLADLTPSALPDDSAALDQLCSVVHKLSGACGTFGEAALGDLAADVEDLARATDPSRADLLIAVERLRAGLAESLA